MALCKVAAFTPKEVVSARGIKIFVLVNMLWSIQEKLKMTIPRHPDYLHWTKGFSKIFLVSTAAYHLYLEQAAAPMFVRSCGPIGGCVMKFYDIEEVVLVLCLPWRYDHHARWYYYHSTDRQITYLSWRSLLLGSGEDKAHRLDVHSNSSMVELRARIVVVSYFVVDHDVASRCYVCTYVHIHTSSNGCVSVSTCWYTQIW